MDELAELAGRQDGAFTSRQAQRWFTLRGIRRQLREGRWLRLHNGVLCISADPLPLTTKLAAAGLALGSPVIACLHSAAELHGFGVIDSDQVHAIDPGRHLPGHSRLALHQLDLEPGEVVDVAGGLLATSPARTAVELARGVRRLRAIAVLDAALRSETVTRDELDEQVDRQAKRRGIVMVRKLVPLADPRAESPMESATRLLCLTAGLPAPTPQFAVRDEFGIPCRYLDLAWPDRKVAVEYDGVEAHAGAIALRRDRARHNFLVERGWTIIYATADDVYRNPERLIRRISLALTRAG